ncbi:phosphoribosylanthranilate isomerase [Prochlorococcus marinus str. MIT 9515]|uniref:N-(5'-phosphoribosyl)anthranilate isomerase n=1 Tax=Prochlorococcus marinus (strain MIT 9515) TaxID=167542 RepID=A2BVJ9_PROM5|nr:phosphoribosylanthranilate isomerase [Prochlorococcus marinus]ABM71810.1 phosphoribosylanthranilate isomerase [Prochlorococcus marinus str. MIT 9515]
MPKTKTLVKICGITSIDQAVQIAELGTNAIGIISVNESPRYISPEKKKEIFKTLKILYPNIERVSVVKNSPIESIIKNFLGEPNETIIQLHGDEDVDYCQQLRQKIPNIGIWKAFRIKNKKDIEKIKIYEKFVDAILLDSWNKETYGGSGKRIEKSYLEELSFSKPWWLAGGVSKEWIYEILKKIKPNGIDISSSVEISPGIKDLEKTKNIIREINK